MRHCGAAMRLMLETAAAATWKVDVSEVQAQLHEVVHKPSGRKLGYGELAARSIGPAGARRRQGQAQGGERLPLHRQGHGPHRRPQRHHHRQGHLRSGRDAAGHEVRGHRQAAGGRRQGRLPRLQRGARRCRAWRRSSRIPGTPAPYKFGPLGGVAVIATQHLGGAEGPRGAQDHLGQRAERGPRLQGLPGAARSGREEARQGRAQRGRRRQGAGLRRQGDHGRVLRAPHPPCDHGAAGGGRAHEPWQMGGVGAGAEPRPGPRRHRRGARRGSGRDHRAADAAGRRLRPQVQVRLRHRGGAAVQGPGRRARSRWCGRARTTCATASTTPPRRSGSRPVSTPRTR